MMKIVHLFNFSKGSRYHAMISQGLHAHPGIDECFAMPFISLGAIIRPAEANIQDALAQADYILRCDDEHFGFSDVDRLLDINKWWRKVIYYDKKDSPAIDMHRLEACAAYVKRSWTIGFNRLPRPPLPRPALPLDFAMLDEYFTIPIPDTKDIDVACLFQHTPRIGRRRFNLISELEKEKKILHNAVIGTCTAAARRGRRALFETPHNNPFLEYLRVLKRARVVFTAYPDGWDGDSRTWEAFASGALVFMDTTTIPSPFPLLHGKHCFAFDARDTRSIKMAIDAAKYYLRNETERRKIAMEGYEYAAGHHRPLNRIEQILAWVNSSEKKLEEHVRLRAQDFFRPLPG